MIVGAVNGADITVHQLPPSPPVSNSGTSLSTSASGAFQWTLDGNDLPGANQSSHTPTENGVYHLIITDGNGCKNTSLPLTIDSIPGSDTTLSIPTYAPNGLDIFPNPNSGQFMVSLPDDLESLTVTDLNGRMLNRKTGPFTRQKNHFFTLDLPSGLYLLHADTKSGRIIQKIIIH